MFSKLYLILLVFVSFNSYSACAEDSSYPPSFRFIILERENPQKASKRLETFEASPPIKFLEIEVMGKGPALSLNFEPLLSKMPLLSTLRVSGNPYASELASILESLSSPLENLFLHKADLRSPEIKVVAAFLQKTTHLKALSLAGNYIEGDGAEALGLALGVNKSLEKLIVSHNNKEGYSDDLLFWLGRGLQGRKEHLSLDLSQNKFETPTGNVSFLFANRSLKSLDINNTNLDLQRVLSSLKMFHDSSQLESLSLNSCSEEFLRVAKDHPTLKYLYLNIMPKSLEGWVPSHSEQKPPLCCIGTPTASEREAWREEEKQRRRQKAEQLQLTDEFETPAATPVGTPLTSPHKKSPNKKEGSPTSVQTTVSDHTSTTTTRSTTPVNSSQN